MNNVLLQDGFKVKGWLSNQPLKKKQRPGRSCNKTATRCHGREDTWNNMEPFSRCFLFNVIQLEEIKLTKRTILSQIAWIFNPVGFTAVFLIRAKIGGWNGIKNYLLLLDWRNTPTETLNSSPAKHLFGRRTKTLLPTSNQLLKPNILKNVEEKLGLKTSKQSMYYKNGAEEVDELHPGDRGRIHPQRSQLGKKKEWTPAKVEGIVDIRSYQVRTEDGRVYRRNR